MCWLVSIVTYLYTSYSSLHDFTAEKKETFLVILLIVIRGSYAWNSLEITNISLF